MQASFGQLLKCLLIVETTRVQSHGSSVFFQAFVQILGSLKLGIGEI